MFIYSIHDIDLHDSEADVIVSDGCFQVLCYAYPIRSVKINQQVLDIFCLSCSHIVKSRTNDFDIIKLPQYYAYSLTAKVSSKQNRIVTVGKLILHIDTSIPNDIENGDYVTFSVQRLDACF